MGVFAKLTQKDEVTHRQTAPLIAAEDVLGAETFLHKEGDIQYCSGLERAVGVPRRRGRAVPPCRWSGLPTSYLLAGGHPMLEVGLKVQTPFHPSLGTGPGPKI